MQGDPQAAIPQVVITLERSSRFNRELAECFDLDQSNIEDFMEAVALWSEDEKLKVLIQVMEFWKGFKLGSEPPPADADGVTCPCGHVGCNTGATLSLGREELNGCGAQKFQN